MGSETARVSVIVVSYNSRNDLTLCLPSILGQPDVLEVVVVDNGSSDGTVSWLQEHYPEVITVAGHGNVGFAKGCNLGAAAAHGDYLFLVNPDTVVAKDAVALLLQTVKSNPNAIATAKVTLADGTINTCGNRMHYTGVASCHEIGKPKASVTGCFSVPLLSGAAFLVATDDWNRLNGFDENYFMYMEDSDFSLRARLLGMQLLCAADAEVEHRYELRMSPAKFYLLERNRLMTLYKTYSRPTLARVTAPLMLTEFATLSFSVLKGPKYVGAKLRAYAWLWQHRKEVAKLRAQVQATRVIDDGQVLALLDEALPFDQLTSAGLGAVLDRVFTPLYRALRLRGGETA